MRTPTARPAAAGFLLGLAVLVTACGPAGAADPASPSPSPTDSGSSKSAYIQLVRLDYAQEGRPGTLSGKVMALATGKAASRLANEHGGRVRKRADGTSWYARVTDPKPRDFSVGPVLDVMYCDYSSSDETCRSGDLLDLRAEDASSAPHTVYQIWFDDHGAVTQIENETDLATG